MDEYIEKAELIKKLCFEAAEWYYSPTIKTIKEFPAADVQPIVYAHKTINVGRRSYCSNCGKLAIMEDFCSKCGAKVKDGDTNE